MFMTPITRIDHWNIRMFSHGLNRPVPVMSDHQDIGVARDHLGRIGDTFPLGRRRRPHVRAADDSSSQTVHGGFKGKASPGAGFVKERGHDLPRPTGLC